MIWPDAPPIEEGTDEQGRHWGTVAPDRPSLKEFTQTHLERSYGDRERLYTEAKRHTQAALTRLGSMVVAGMLAHPQDSRATRAMFDHLRAVIAEIDEKELLIMRDRAKAKVKIEAEYAQTDWKAKGYH